MKHQVPAEFKHYIKFSVNYIKSTDFLIQLFHIYPQNEGQVMLLFEDHKTYFYPMTGLVEIEGKKMYFHNQEKQGYVYLWGKLKEDLTFCVEVVQKQQLEKSLKNRLLYKLNGNGQWSPSGTFPFRSKDNFVGYQHYLEKICKDIGIYQKHQLFLRSIGESKSINYLLYGPPGTGKTSLIFTLASIFNYPVYVMNSMSKAYSVLTPVTHGISILLFEDFDRYLSDSDKTNMSDILNSLDGVNDHEGVVRFFTGNNCEAIFENKALINRMSACFKFENPSQCMFEQKLDKLLGGLKRELTADEALLKTLFLAKITLIPGLTLRPFVNYVLRYAFDVNPLPFQKLLDNLHELNIY